MLFATKGFEMKKYARKCSECENLMNKGFCIEGGDAYYCSEECLHKNISREEFKELYDDGDGDSYWTEWEDND